MLHAVCLVVCSLLLASCSSSDEDRAPAASSDKGVDASCDSSSDIPDATGAEPAPLGEPCTGSCVQNATCQQDACADEDACPKRCRAVVAACSSGACEQKDFCASFFDLSTKSQRGYCSPRAQLGAPCINAKDACVDGAYCAEDADTVHSYHCRKLAGGGETCTNTFYESCVAGYRCDSTTKTCVVRKGEKSACAKSYECLEELFCSQETFQCEKKHPAGGTCRPTGYRCEGTTCVGLSDNCADGLACAKRAGHEGCFVRMDCGGYESYCCAREQNAGECALEEVCLPPEGTCASP